MQEGYGGVRSSEFPEGEMGCAQSACSAMEEE